MKTPTEKNQATKSRGGPASLIGKAISSKNALKEGATARHFINDEEKEQFEDICSNLKKIYPSSNYLASMQIKRLARLYILLERINNIIDARFVLSRSDSKSLDSLQKRLDINESEMSVLSKMYLGEINEEDLNQFAEKKAFKELPLIALQKKFISQQEYLDKTPEFCKFIYEEADRKNLTITEFINTVAKKKIGAKINSPAEPQIVIYKWKDDAEDRKERESLETSILNTSFDDLQRVSDWFAGEYARTFKTLTKFENFMDLYSTEKESSAPDFDELDKLMRYQTALQRQVSTSIGELLALTK